MQFPTTSGATLQDIELTAISQRHLDEPNLDR